MNDGSITIAPADLLALLPVIVLTGATVTIMLVVSLKRDHRLVALLTFVAFTLAIASILPAASHARDVAGLLRIDGYALFVMALLLTASLLVGVLCYFYYRVRPGVHEELYLLLMMATLGALVLAASNHFAAFFLGLELLSVSLFALVPYTLAGPQRLPVEAGAKYLVLAGVATAALLFGIALVYAALGSLSFPVIGERLLANNATAYPYLLTGVALITVGVAFKLSLVPFHMWTPDVYQGAPAPITGYLATVSKAAVFALLLRWFLELGLDRYSQVGYLLGMLALVSMLVGNLLALLQQSVKRLLAYSSIAHMGYLLVALLAVNSLGVEAVLFYLVAYVIMNLGAFAVVSVMSSSGTDEHDDISHFQGLFWRRPWLAVTFTGMLLSLAGIPLTVGFVGKFYIVAAGVEAALWVLLAAVIVGSVIGLYYYLRLVVVMYMAVEEPVSSRAAPRMPLPATLVLVTLTALLLGLGVFPAGLIDAIQHSALVLP